MSEKNIKVGDGQAIQAAAECLHAAGWCPGMSAEDAARLLSEAP